MSSWDYPKALNHVSRLGKALFKIYFYKFAIQSPLNALFLS